MTESPVLWRARNHGSLLRRLSIGLCVVVVVGAAIIMVYYSPIGPSRGYLALVFQGYVQNAFGLAERGCPECFESMQGFEYWPTVRVVRWQDEKVTLRLWQGIMHPVPQAGIELLLRLPLLKGDGKAQFDSRQGNIEAWLFRQNGDSWRFDEPVPTVEYWKYEKDELAAFPGMFELSGQVEIAFAGSEVVYLRVELQTREPVFAEWGWLRHREKLNLEMMEKYRKTPRYQQQLKLWTRIREGYSGIEAPAEFRGEFKLERRYELPV